jgi:hypothetical protein
MIITLITQHYPTLTCPLYPDRHKQVVQLGLDRIHGHIETANPYQNAS